MKYQAVLFDFDGTLTPSLPLWVKAYGYALQRFDILLSDADIVRRCFFRDWHVVAADIGVASADELREHVNTGLRTAFLEATLFPLVPALLRQCRRHGLDTALVTSSPRRLVMDVAARLRVVDQLDFIICGDDVAHYKPHPEALLRTLTALGRAPHEAIMIGDSRVDILAGKAAGTATALFLPADHGAFHCEQTLRAANPDHIFAHHAELPGLLGIPACEESDGLDSP